MARILLISHKADLNGAPISLFNLAKVLRQDHDITIAFPQPGRLLKQITLEDIHWQILSIRYRNIFTLARFIKKNQFDLVFGGNFSGAAWITLIAARIAGIPFIWRICEVFDERYVVNPATFRRVRHANQVIAVSNANARAINKFVPGKHIHTIHEGLDADIFNLPKQLGRETLHRIFNIADDAIIILNIGSIYKLKNQLDAIKIATQVIAQNPAAVFIFIGAIKDNEYANRIHDWIKKHQAENNIILAGRREDIPAFLCGADILIHTSKIESFSLAVLEAMAAGLPAIAYNVPGGLEELIVHEETGYLIPFGQRAEFAEQLNTLIDDSEKRKKLGKRAKQRARSLFDIQITKMKTNRIIEAVLQKDPNKNSKTK
jgi:glycosyltransferase involved in cell wall biosynthesis